MSENIMESSPLPAPQMPQMSSLKIITVEQTVVGGGVFIVVTEYSDAATGDYIEVFWDNQSVREILVGSPPADFFPMAIVVTEGINRGSHTCYYTAKDASGNQNQSTSVGVVIENVTPPAIIYPSPIFLDAVNNVITQESLTENSGTHIHVNPYENITENDTVVLFWNGYSSGGENVSADVLINTVTTAELSAGITFLIPEDKFTKLDKGKVSTYYEIRRNGNNTGISYSGLADVDLSGGNVSDLKMCVSTGAVNTDYTSIHVYPFNQGVIKGPAGANVALSLTGASAVFAESGTANSTVTLNIDGIARFGIWSELQGGVSVNAYEINHPDLTAQQTITFGPYTKGQGNIQYLNHSTGAPADGLTPCSVYLKTAPSSGGKLNAAITLVRVRITSASGSAAIVGYEGSSMADILLNSDQSAEIDIVSSAAESVSVELSLPESSGSVNRLNIAFVAF